MNQWLPSYGAICWLSEILARFGRKKSEINEKQDTADQNLPRLNLYILTRPKGSPKYRRDS